MNNKTIILLIIGIGILAAMVLYIGPGKIESALKNANPLYVALAVGIQFLIWDVDPKVDHHNPFT